jgi:tRNA uridine 5-carboxymethylaminomethyl modification enzyme
MHYGCRLGLIGRTAQDRLARKEELIEEGLQFTRSRSIEPQRVNSYLESVGSERIVERERIDRLLRRPEVRLDALLGLDGFAESQFIRRMKNGVSGRMQREVLEQIEIEMKYEGYIARQQEQVERFEKLESQAIPADFDYARVKSLSVEGREKLMKVRPASIGQASRISGVTPSDVSVLMVYLRT